MNFELIDKIIEFESIDSTQLFAKEIIKEKPNGNILIIAQTQEKGYGRHGTYWSSEKGGIYFTLITKMNILCNDVSKLSLQTAKSVKEILELYNVKAKIKEPNDVYAQIGKSFKKISGILIDIISVDSEKYILFGIGINTNNKIPKNLSLAISLKNILGKEIDNNEFLKKFLNIFWNKIKAIECSKE